MTLKNWNDLTPEQQAAIRNPGNGDPAGGWNMYPRVDAEEAKALRDGKAYRLSTLDIERISNAAYLDMGLDGDPDTDPLIIKALATGLIAENPRYIAEKAAYEVRIVEMQKEYGAGNYSVGVGFSARRWTLTAAGHEFARKLGGE